MHTQKCKNPRDLDLWLMTLIFNTVLEVVEVHVYTKFHQAKWSGSQVIMLTNFIALSRNDEKFKNLVLWPCPWPMTLIFNRVLVVVNVDVQTKCHGSKCSSSWVIVLKERKDSAENNTVVANAERTLTKGTTIHYTFIHSSCFRQQCHVNEVLPHLLWYFCSWNW